MKVANAREALAKTATVVNGDPSHKLDLVGITGTNGKTTTTYLCFALAEASGQKPAMLTTVEYRIGENGDQRFCQGLQRPAEHGLDADGRAWLGARAHARRR